MDIQLVRAKRYELEQAIQRLLVAFQKETSAQVIGVEVERLATWIVKDDRHTQEIGTVTVSCML